MTPELSERLDKGESPFNGLSVVTCNDPGIEQVRQMVEYCFNLLSEDWGEILMTHDWHEHDGFIQNATKTTWEQCRHWVRTAKAFYESGDKDFAVRIAVYPPSMEWLLRFNIDDEDESDWTTAWADMDFSAGNNQRAIQIAKSLYHKFPGNSEIVSSKEHFDATYGGEEHESSRRW